MPQQVGMGVAMWNQPKCVMLDSALHAGHAGLFQLIDQEPVWAAVHAQHRNARRWLQGFQ